MIGTTLKVGMDTSRVTRGLSKISRGFGAFSKQVGIGATRRVGEKMTDLAGRLAMAIPGTIRDTAEYISNLDSLRMKTGMSAQELILLEEKMRLAGVETSDTSDAISNLAEKLYEARTEGGSAKEALNDLRFAATEFEDLSLDEAFDKIGKRVAKMGKHEIPKMTWALAQIFGGDVGMELVKAFRNYEEVTNDAITNTVAMRELVGREGLVGDIDKFNDSMGRFRMLKMQMGIGIIDALTAGTGKQFLDDMFNVLQNDVLPVIMEITKKFGDFIGKIRESGDPLGAIAESLKGISKSIGKSIADGFRESLGEMISPGAMIKGLFKGKTAMGTLDSREAIQLLAKIERKLPVEATFS